MLKNSMYDVGIPSLRYDTRYMHTVQNACDRWIDPKTGRDPNGYVFVEVER